MTSENADLYSDILRSLVASVMRAQAEFISAYANGTSFDEIADGAINRHFSWLALQFPEGTNRHLFEATPGHFPLRTGDLRNRKGIPAIVRAALAERRPLDSPSKRLQKHRAVPAYVQSSVTRISALIRSSFASFSEENEAIGDLEEDEDPPLVIKAALAVVYDYLTVPEFPGARAYALVALRNLLFEEFELVPDIYPQKKGPRTFSVSELSDSLSKINTSIRQRFYSRGEDKLPPEGRFSCDGLLRQFLAMKSAFNYRFQTVESCLRYLHAGELRATKTTGSTGYDYEFAKSTRMEKLPDSGEIVNELWGLPLPIRGAETVFRGGLKFTAAQGLVMAVHGGPGTGKTSFVLALGAYLAPFGIKTLFITAEEDESDLRSRMASLIPDEIRRLSIFPKDKKVGVDIVKIPMPSGSSSDGQLLEGLMRDLSELASTLAAPADAELGASEEILVPKPCRVVVILDGLHDLFVDLRRAGLSEGAQVGQLYPLIATLRKLRALVVVTTGSNWAGATSLDYMVDVAVHLSHEAISENSAKPERRLKLIKARHQLAASGTHGFQLSGQKGVRFSPQINYQLDRRAVWKTALPQYSQTKSVLRRVVSWSSFERMLRSPAEALPGEGEFFSSASGPAIFQGSHIFINGQGSSGKAALALKIAIAPADGYPTASSSRRERVLIVSFLYPSSYYDDLARYLRRLHQREYGRATSSAEARVRVIQLHPGHLQPNDLYNKIEWELQAAELDGEPYSAVIIDGIHNVFVQFPEIEKYSLIWPQLYNSLRTRGVMAITTHTILRPPKLLDGSSTNLYLDDERSEPLRNALIQKTDFQIEIDPYPEPIDFVDSAQPEALQDMFLVRTVASIRQPIPREPSLWSRERLVFVQMPTVQPELGLKT